MDGEEASVDTFESISDNPVHMSNDDSGNT